MNKKKAAKITPPLSLETLKDYAEDIFKPIRRGENVTTIWVAMAGRRIRNKFIINYSEVFKEEIGETNKYLLVYIEPLELTEESNVGYIKLLIKSIVEGYNKQLSRNLKRLPTEKYLPSKSSVDYSQLLELIRKLIKDIISQKKEVVLFLGEFDELEFAGSILYNNLKALWADLKGKLHFVFLLLEDMTRPEAINKYGELNELLLQNIIYVPLIGKRDIDYLVDYFGSQFKREFLKEEKDLLSKICGGHPYLIKSCSRIVALMDGEKLGTPELEKRLLSHFEPRSASQKIFDYRDQVEKNFLRKVIKNGKTQELPESAGTLANLGLIRRDKDGTWAPFSRLFKSCIEEGRGGLESPRATDAKLFFDEKSGAILMDEENVEENFTRQEYEVLRFFLKEPNHLRSRDEISEAMWGKESYDKYSDWAIDQLMSKIRKKLKNLGAGNVLVTVRGRGYKIVLS